jgi:hypothetical protein
MPAPTADVPCEGGSVSKTPMTRRFPAPWSVRELEQAFAVVDANGQAVAYRAASPRLG